MQVRRSSQFRRRLRVALVAIAVALVLGGVAYAVWFSDLFEIKAVNVEGAVLTDAEVFRGGSGGNILFWKLQADTQSMAELASVTVEKDFFAQTVTIVIVEREKALIWCLEKQGECFWADAGGFIFTEAPEPEGSFVVSAVRDYTERDLRVGSHVLETELFVNLKAIIGLLQDADIPVAELRIDDLRFKEATAVTGAGPEIYFSLLFDPRFGEGVLDSLMASPEWSQIRYIDLRVENRAYYSL